MTPATATASTVKRKPNLSLFINPNTSKAIFAAAPPTKETRAKGEIF